MMYDNFLGIFNFRKDGVVDGVDAMLLSMNSALGGKGLALPFVGMIFKLVKVVSAESVEAIDAWRRSWLRDDEYQLVMLPVFLVSQLEGLSVSPYVWLWLKCSS